jgi:hypothetical protein
MIKKEDLDVYFLLTALMALLFYKSYGNIVKILVNLSPYLIAILTAIALMTLIRMRRIPLRKGSLVVPARLSVYDKDANINLNRLKDIAEGMGLRIIFLISVGRSSSLIGRSPGKISYKMLLIGKDKEIIRAGASAINSTSEGFKIEILERYLDPDLAKEIIEICDESEAVSIGLGRSSERDELILEIGERRGRVIGIPVSELTKHILVIGQTGSGKTTTVKRIIYEAWNLGIPSLVLDSHWEYRNLIFGIGGRIFCNRPGYPQICINPLISIPKGEKEIFLVAETLSSLLDLTPSQFYLLLKALRRLSDISSERNPPNMYDLLMEIKGFSTSSQPEEESRASLVRKLEPLISGGGEVIFKCDNILSTGFEEVPTLLELGDIESDLQKRLIAFFTLKRIKDYYIREEAKSKYPRLIVVLEEAEKLIPYYKDQIGMELISRLFAELRKFGVALILVSQSLSEIPEGAIRNTGIKIIHKVESPSDLKFLRTLLREKNIVDKVLSLTPGGCVMSLPGTLESLQVRPVDELPLSRESVDEAIMMNSFYWISR